MSRRASHKQISKRALRMEPLEAKQLLTVNFGFVDVAGGFTFIIDGDDVGENYQMWTNTEGNLNTNFAVQDRADGSISLADSVSAGEIANEATQRGLGISDFKGFEVKAQGGDDLVAADGSLNVLGTVPAPGEFFGQQFRADGGAGHDTLRGGPGDDILSTGPAPNNDKTEVIEGNDGNDTIMGNNGLDSLSGGAGNDVIEGGSNNDTIDGGVGNDNLDGEDGNDRVRGGDGDDTVNGGGGHDILQGDNGSDRLDGGSGDDSMLGDDKDKDPVGGTGSDGWQAGPTTGTQGDTGSGAGDAGNINITANDIEKIRTDGSNAGMCPHKNSDSCGGGGGDANVRFDSPGPFSDTGPFAFHDNINVKGWTIDDVVGPWVITGGGNDLVLGSDTGRDSVEAGAGNDTVRTGGGVDTIRGGSGDDVIEGGAGGDLIDGGTGNDTASYESSPAGVTIDLDVRVGGEGSNLNDPVDSIGSGGDAQGDNLVRTGTTGDNTIETLVGSAFDDRLTGDATDNLLMGNDGNDTLRGAGGNDGLLGDDGTDLLEGDGGKEATAHVDGSDTLRGGKGEDTALGGGANDFLDGGLGDDDLNGEAGIDGIEGDKGQDTIRMDYANGQLTDLTLPTALGVFGSEGNDNFLVTGTTSIQDELDVRGELAVSRLQGLSDFDNNDDDLGFV